MDISNSSIYSDLRSYGFKEIPIGFDIAISWANCDQNGNQMFDLNNATFHWDLKDITNTTVLSKSTIFTYSPNTLYFKLSNSETATLAPGRYKAIMWYEKDGIKTKIGCCNYVAVDC